MADERLHIAIIASPGMGHLIPALLLANRLLTHKNLHVTILIISTPTSPAESELLRPLTGSEHITIVKIPSPDISNLVDPNATAITRLYIMMKEVRTAIRAAIIAMSHHRPNVLISDLFATESASIADEFGMAKCAYVTSSAWFLALNVYCHVLDGEVEGQYVDQKEPLRIPGCKAVLPEDVVDPMLDRFSENYRAFMKRGKDWTGFDSILINTWEDLDSKSIYALKDGPLRSILKGQIYPIGPLSRPFKPTSSNSKNELVDWLDLQPTESVLYISFGSGGTISSKQITELAWGLEMSKQRFIWVVRPPKGINVDASFFTAGSCEDALSDFLPYGFIKRTHKVGLVVSNWVPQVDILNHPSVGGFLSHCGLNSIYESIEGGVPIVAWPLFAEQRLNATLLTEEAKVAVRPETLPTKKVVGRVEIEKMVGSLMESEKGKGMRAKIKKLKESAHEALRPGVDLLMIH